MLDAVDGLEARRVPGRAGEQADREVGAGPLVVQGVEAALGEARGGVAQRLRADAPDRDRVLLVEPAHVHQLVLQAGERLGGLELAEHQAAPGGGRAGHDRPVGRARVDDLARLLDGGQAVAPRADRVEVGEQARRDRAGEPDPRAALVAELEHALPYQEGTKSSVSGRACSIRARLTHGSNHCTSTKRAPCR